MDRVHPAVFGEVAVDELRASVAVQAEIERVRQPGVVVIDLRQEVLDGLSGLGLRAEQGCVDERPLDIITAGSRWAASGAAGASAAASASAGGVGAGCGSVCVAASAPPSGRSGRMVRTKKYVTMSRWMCLPGRGDGSCGPERSTVQTPRETL
eukprot:3872757-Pyramimonas_sp.AAC.1